MLNNLCGMSIDTLGVVIGWVGGVLSFVSVIIVGICLGYIDEVTKIIMEHTQDPNITAENVRGGIIIIGSFYLAMNVINLVASALLVLGTLRERHLMLVPWLLNAGVSLLFSAIYLIYLLIAIVSSSGGFDSILLPLITTGLSFAFQYVIWYVIYSLYKNIQFYRNQHRLLRPATCSRSANVKMYT